MIVVIVDFLRKLIPFTKNLVQETKAEWPEYKRQALEEYLQEENEKLRIGKKAFYKMKAKNFWENHAVNLYSMFLTIVLVIIFIYFRFERWLPEGITIQNFKYPAFIFLPVQLVLFFIFVCSKSNKNRWVSALALFVFFVLGALWALQSGAIDRALRHGCSCIILLPLLIHYYQRWRQDNKKKFDELQQYLQISENRNDELLKQYRVLQEQRHDEKKHLSILQTLQLENEIEAMQAYLKQLEEQQKEEAHHEET